MSPIALVPQTDASRAPALATEEVHGHLVLMAIGAELDSLARRCRAPMTAQATWLLATVDARCDERAWAVIARDDSGALIGAVVMLDRTEGQRDTVSLAGTDHEQRGAVLTDSVTVAYALGEAVSRSVGRRLRTPDVELGPLPAGSSIVQAFGQGLHGSTRIEVAGIPIVRRADESDARDVDAYLSHGMRRTVRKANNRLFRDDRAGTISFTSDAAQILRMLPQLEQCHRNRDHAHSRLSDLDDAQQRGLWKRRILALARAGELELATLHVDEEFAAYTLGVVDGAVYRLLEGRCETRWTRYSPGRVLEAAVVQRMLDDPGLVALDWMTSVASESLLATNDADPMVVLRMSGERIR